MYTYTLPLTNECAFLEWMWWRVNFEENYLFFLIVFSVNALSTTTKPTTPSTTSSNSTSQATKKRIPQPTTEIPEGSGNTIDEGTVLFIILLLLFTFFILMDILINEKTI